MRRLNILKIILVISTGVLFFYYGRAVPLSEQWPVYEALRNTSAIIFGVMGAWLAILYPAGLLNVFGKGNAKLTEKESQNVKKLFPPIIYSTIIIAYVLLAGAIAPVLKTITPIIAHRDLLRGLSYAVISMLTLIQLWALILTLVPSYFLQRQIGIHEGKQAQKKRMFSGTQKPKK